MLYQRNVMKAMKETGKRRERRNKRNSV